LRELEIYIHIPFCVRKCGYCDFLSAPAKREQRDRYVRTLLEEIRGGAPVSALPHFMHRAGQGDLRLKPHPARAGRIGERSVPLSDHTDRVRNYSSLCWTRPGADYIVSSVFFGGGTPSLLPALQIAEILDALRARFHFSDHAEITIECNPGSLDSRLLGAQECREGVSNEYNPGSFTNSFVRERERKNEEEMEAYLACGINRISFGLQSANDAELAALGRIHTFETFLRSYESARNAGFTNINVDLMSALPGQTVESWKTTLRQVRSLAPEHISAYSLIIEEGTPFFEKYHEDDLRRADGEQPQFLPSEEEERQMYALTEQMLAEAGYVHYEISNYALPGYECRHNIGYWRGTEYMGFGLGASSLLRSLPADSECAVTKNRDGVQPCPDGSSKTNAGIGADKQKKIQEIKKAYAAGSVRCKNPIDHTEYERLVRSKKQYGAGEPDACDSDMDRSDLNDSDKDKSASGGNASRPSAFDEETFQLLSINDEMSEFMFLGLRMLSGVSEKEFFARFGVRIDTVYGEALERLVSLKLLRWENGRIVLTRRGLNLSNPVMAEFLL